MFGNIETDIQTRIPDRPPRPIPTKISDMPEIPWLASEYVPQADNKPSLRTLISRTVRTGIPIIGTLILLGLIGYGAVQLFSFYS
jgi:hypothetical protein